jgi:hypothetical protein
VLAKVVQHQAQEAWVKAATLYLAVERPECLHLEIMVGYTAAAAAHVFILQLVPAAMVPLVL